INVTVDAVVTAKIGDAEELIQVAAQNFLNKDVDAIRAKIVDILEGNMREIVGQMQLVDLVSDRKQVSDKVLSNAKPDLEKLGIVIQTLSLLPLRRRRRLHMA
ncbi:flotillin family protein, partial [Pseudomonas syringae pv. tomato]|uniref:flotillin family protein n=1 Tax=Pseudomonas syringae group genomosp. 3 TaxID=251701 RepID=UPI0022A7D996